MKICVIGSGIAGLTTAFHLSQDAGVSVTVYERAGQFGGRADVPEDWEHGPRFFMDDYSGADRSVLDSPRRVRRSAHTPSVGWVETSHLYPVLAKEVSWRRKIRILRAWRASALAAGQSQNAKWVARLRARGVDLRTDTAVTAIEPQPWAVTVRTVEGAAEFDGVVVTAFVPGLMALLEASRIGHSVIENGHTHCVAYTLDLDPREAVLTAPGPGLYCREGISMLVQPGRCRCVVLCVTSKSTEARIVLPKVREFLGLEHDFVRVGMRLNRQNCDGVFVGEYLCPDRILRRPTRRVYFAGSAIHNSYLADSAEGAVRSALAATAQLRRDLGLPAARAAGPTDKNTTKNTTEKEGVCTMESH